MMDFQPRFSHFVALMILVAVFGVAGTLLGSFEVLSGILSLCSIFCLVIAVGWIHMLMSESATRRLVDRQDAKRSQMAEIVDLARALAPRLPPAALLQALGTAFPESGLDQVVLPDELADQQSADGEGWHMRRGIRWGLATIEQYQQLARDYFENGRGLAIRYWTETRTDKQGREISPVFSRKQFEEILDEITQNGLGFKTVNGETFFHQNGESWLKQYYSPTPEGFSKITGKA